MRGDPSTSTSFLRPAVRWNVATHFVRAWGITMPVAAVMGAWF
jgi:hypothetical protein